MQKIRTYVNMLYKKLNWTLHSIYNGCHLITNGDDPISLLMLGIYSIMLYKKNIELTISDIQKNPIINWTVHSIPKGGHPFPCF